MKIHQTIQRLGLPWKLDSITEGDGNCFSRAVVQQCQREVLQEDLKREKRYTKDYKTLKKKVVNFIKNSKIALLGEMKQSYEALQGEGGEDESWDNYWERMMIDKEWADAMFVQATAWYLNRDIWMLPEDGKDNQPWMTISGNWQSHAVPCPGVPLLLGYNNGLHYQSLLPFDESRIQSQPQWCSVDQIVHAAIREKVKVTEKIHWSALPDQHNLISDKSLLPVGEELVVGEEVNRWVFSAPGGDVTVMVTRKEGYGYEFTCLFCNTIQKQVSSHMKKVHGKKFSPEVLKQLQDSWKKYSKSLANKKQHNKRMEEDHEGLKEQQREGQERSRKKRREEDHEGLKEQQREEQERSRNKRREEDHKGLKEQQKMHKQTERSNNEKRFFEETKYSCDFPCVCCHGLLFKDQVVEFSEKVKERIRRKAEEAHSKAQVIICYFCCSYHISPYSKYLTNLIL